MALMPTRTNCSICEKVIKDQQKGQESIFCERDCQAWMHRICAGISRKAFGKAKSSDDPFFCHYCLCHKQETEIINLKTTINSLQSELAQLKQPGLQPMQVPNTVTDNHLSYASILKSSTASSQPPSTKQPLPDSKQDRKFNIVVYGIKECSKGTSRLERITKDSEEVTNTIQKLDNTISSQSVRDCVRLGKYNTSRCRPILVTLSRSCEVSSILALRKNLSG